MYRNNNNHCPISLSVQALLPLDVWFHIGDYLELRDLPNILVVNRAFHQLFDQEGMFAQFARRKFPPQTLKISSYHGSWKQLLKDDNAENGFYLRTMFVLSEWRHNRIYAHLHYLNAIRCMIWDKRNRKVHIGIEAFGNTDLRKASTTSIFQMQGGGLQPQHSGQQSGRNSRSLPLPELERRLRMTSVRELVPSTTFQSHDLCILTLEDRCFNQSNCYYIFTYNGSEDSLGSDYESKIFLQDCSSLKQCFQLGYSNRVPGINHCDFVSNDTPLLRPSNVLDWPKMATALDFDDQDNIERQKVLDNILPPTIRRLHLDRQWGVVQSFH